MDMNTVLEVRNVTKTFPGTKALDDVSIQISKGEIRAIVGENGAGKSTLMNVISGVFPFDEGAILIDGEEVHYTGPADAYKKGIGFVHQELALCTSLSVAYNVFLGRLPEKHGFIDKKKLYQDTAKVLEQFDVQFGPNDTVATMSPAEQQIVEIAHALSGDCKVLIFDEPTSSLTESEAENLFHIIDRLRDNGMTIIYISHKLSEIFEHCDTITIMRDGKVVDNKKVADITPEYVTSQMVGRAMNALYPPKSSVRTQEPLLQVSGFTSFPKFTDAGFTLYKGEILGLCGLLGAGRSELVRAVCGIDPCESGTVIFEGQEVHFKNYRQTLESGICYLTENRKLDGIFPGFSIAQNIETMIMKEYSTATLLHQKQINAVAQEYRDKLNVKSTGLSQTVGSLSGGNQQKVLVARMLATKPKVVILDEPTRGIDVGAKYEIHKLLRELCDEGMGVIVISSEFPETVGVCDRVVVMSEGRTIKEVTGSDITQENLVRYASGEV